MIDNLRVFWGSLVVGVVAGYASLHGTPDPCHKLNETAIYRIYNRGKAAFVLTQLVSIRSFLLSDLNASSLLQQYRVRAVEVSDGAFSVIREDNPKSGWTMDEASMEDGMAIWRRKYLGGDHQKWFIEHGTQGYCVIRNKNSGKFLDGRNRINGTIGQWPLMSGDPNQEWLFLPTERKKIRSPAEADVKQCDILNGVNVCVYTL